MVNIKLHKKAELQFYRLKEKIGYSPTNKKTIEFMLWDYERTKLENEILQDRMRKMKLVNKVAKNIKS